MSKGSNGMAMMVVIGVVAILFTMFHGTGIFDRDNVIALCEPLCMEDNMEFSWELKAINGREKPNDFNDIGYCGCQVYNPDLQDFEKKWIEVSE